MNFQTENPYIGGTLTLLYVLGVAIACGFMIRGIIRSKRELKEMKKETERIKRGY